MAAVRLLVGLLLLLPAAGLAQTAAQPAAPTPAPEALVPPRPLTATTVEYPAEATPITAPVTVKVKIVVDTAGTVKKVVAIPPLQPPFDDAVVRAAQAFRFEPATFKGKPVAVEILFSHTFLPPPMPLPMDVTQLDSGPVRDSFLRGKLVEKGTRVPVAGATVDALVRGKHYTAEADLRGRFRMALPSGEARITVHAAGYKAFLQFEALLPKQELAIAYYVERERYDPYEILVYGEQRREELSRITLRGPEIRQVPGTFGDPFRVVQALPGVSSLVSLLPYPVVRGASPGSTGYLIDATRVPLLYHLLAGPSVIHPEFIDEVQFYPGNAPVLYGGYTAGIVDGKTRRARSDEKLLDFDANLLQAGGFVRQPLGIGGATLTAAGRYGYPGIIMSLATDQASLSYWDYQVRLDGGTPRNGWTAFAFGASDTVKTPASGTPADMVNPPLEPSLILAFHRLDLRYQHNDSDLEQFFRLVSGVDQTLAGTQSINKYVLEPTARWRYKATPQLDLVAGLEGSYHYTLAESTTSTVASQGGGANSASSFLNSNSAQTMWLGTALTEVLWRPSPNWLFRPGVRADWRYDGETTAVAADPRLAIRYKALALDLPGDTTAGSQDRAVWLKGGVGIYHQPPRLFLPIPGLDALPLRYGLLQSIQSSVGAEIPVASGVGLSAEAYYNHMDPVVFDLSTNQSVTQLVKTGPTCLPGEVCESATPTNNVQRTIDSLIKPQRGRSYGLELMLRRQSRTGLYGWIAYTLSASEREKDGAWVPYDYDRTQLVNVVAGVPLPRNWDVGVRFQYQSGKPATTTSGYNTARIDSYMRIDVRIDKRAVWNKWLFDFYVDLTNINLMPEEVSPGNTIRYVLPTVGVRARL